LASRPVGIKLTALAGIALVATVAVGGVSVRAFGAAARTDLADHSTILRDGVARFGQPDVSAGARAAAEPVAPVVAQYLTLAEQTLTAALRGGGTPANYPAFVTAFEAVEQQLPEIGDAVAEQAGIAAVATAASASTAGAEQSLEAARDLAAMAVQLQQLVARFQH
jgi:hypothetical protein